MSPVRLGPVMKESMLGMWPSCLSFAAWRASASVATIWSHVATTMCTCGRIERARPPEVALETRIEPVWATSASHDVMPASQDSSEFLSKSAASTR